MGVAQGMVDIAERTIGHEAVMHDDAAFQVRWDCAALFLRPIEGEGRARGRVQPMQPARGPQACFVEMANLLAGHARADPDIDPLQIEGLLPHPGGQAGRTQRWRSEQVAKRLSRAIFGNELLDIQINRRRLDPLAILRRRDDAGGKRRLGPASAMPATLERGAVFGDGQRALDEIEHLSGFEILRLPRFERLEAMLAMRRLVPNDPVGFAHLPQRVALVALLPAARFARRLPQAPGDPRRLRQSVARRRLRTRRTVLSEPPLQFRHLRLQRRDLAAKRRNQILDLGRKNHPYLDSHPARPVSQNPPIKPAFPAQCDKSDSQNGTAWELQKKFPALFSGCVQHVSDGLFSPFPRGARRQAWSVPGGRVCHRRR